MLSGRLRVCLDLATALLVLGIGWLWAGNSGAALGLLWWRTPTFSDPWHYRPVPLEAWRSRDHSLWLCPWLVVRLVTPLAERPSSTQGFAVRNHSCCACETICCDDLDAAEFARVRREWLGRTD